MKPVPVIGWNAFGVGSVVVLGGGLKDVELLIPLRKRLVALIDDAEKVMVDGMWAREAKAKAGLIAALCRAARAAKSPARAAMPNDPARNGAGTARVSSCSSEG